MESKILDRVAKLLAQAESTDNAAEAEAFVAGAQRLATLNAIDLAVARQHTVKKQRREEPEQRGIKIGEHRRKNNRHLVNLFSAVAYPNDVVLNISADSVYVFAFGFGSDLDVVEALYSSLAVQMVDAANRAIKDGAHKEETFYAPERWHASSGTWVGGRYRTDARVFRTSFYEGFTASIGARLWLARREAIDETPKTPEQVSDGAELVLVAKHDEVKSFYAKKSNAKGSWKGNDIGARGSANGHSRGREAGQTARLGSQNALPGAKGSLGGSR